MKLVLQVTRPNLELVKSCPPAPKKWGGARTGAAGSISTLELRALVMDELIIPAVIISRLAPVTIYGNLTAFNPIIMSSTDIGLAYGRRGLDIWKEYWTVSKRGHSGRNHKGYSTVWSLITISKSNPRFRPLPDIIMPTEMPEWPSRAFLDRLKDRNERAADKRMRRFTKKGALV